MSKSPCNGINCLSPVSHEYWDQWWSPITLASFNKTCTSVSAWNVTSEKFGSVSGDCSTDFGSHTSVDNDQNQLNNYPHRKITGWWLNQPVEQICVNQKEHHLPTIHFQVRDMSVSGRVPRGTHGEALTLPFQALNPYQTQTKQTNKQTNKQTTCLLHEPKVMEVDGSNDFPFEKRVIFRFQSLNFQGVLNLIENTNNPSHPLPRCDGEIHTT